MAVSLAVENTVGLDGYDVRDIILTGQRRCFGGLTDVNTNVLNSNLVYSNEPSRSGMRSMTIILPPKSAFHDSKACIPYAIAISQTHLELTNVNAKALPRAKT